MIKFLKVILFIVLILAGILLLLLRYPTTAPEVHSTFAPKVDLDHLGPLKITWVPTGYSMAWEPFIISGGRFREAVKMVYGALLVEHPKGTFLIDGSLGTGIEEEIARAGWLLKALFPMEVASSIAGQKGNFPKLKNVQDIFITHSHFDHLSGAKDFPGVPILMLPEEIEFIQNAEPRALTVVFPEQRETLQSRFKAIPLKEQPYESFARSLDWFGDGSVVLVPLPGHTPGSLGIFLNVSPTQRYLVVGDALWSVDARGKPEARSLLAEWFADNDSERARMTRAQLGELIQKSNEITLVPIHDEDVLVNFVK
jgi:glyoxylase-like metal-dependent hydrolase (beta-lactamase superfamily II)